MEENEKQQESYDELKTRVSEMTSKDEIMSEISSLKDKMRISGISEDEIKKIEHEANLKRKKMFFIRWVKSSAFPRFLLNVFQVFLIVEKVFGFIPFGHLPWLIIIFPFMTMFVSDIIWLSMLSEKELNDLLKDSKKEDK